MSTLEWKIQDDTLTGDLSSVDVATEKNLNELVKVGEALLKKQVSRVNLQTGIYEVAGHETNEEALIRYHQLPSPCDLKEKTNYMAFLIS